jgi:hypothetical protein
VRAHLADMKMKRDLSDIPGELPDADGLLALMAQDKKVVDGQLRFILARGIGEAFVTADVPGRCLPCACPARPMKKSLACCPRATVGLQRAWSAPTSPSWAVFWYENLFTR